MPIDLYGVYRYFSHHTRNSTAMIAASVTLLSHKMSADEQSLVEDVIDSSFLLDLFDAGMGVCFENLGNKETEHLDIFDIEHTVRHFINRCRKIIAERSVSIEFRVEDPGKILASAHDLRILTSIILYEMILQTLGTLTIEAKRNILTITSEGFDTVPPVWQTFAKVLKDKKVNFIYSKDSCILEFGG